MPRSPDAVHRFSLGERWIHLSVAALFGVCIATAACLYVDPLSALVGRRDLIAGVHYVSGLLLPLPVVIGFIRSAAFRRDSRQLNRFTPRDWSWLRSRNRRDGSIPVGKFNAGQKLNSAFTLGAIVVLFATGLMLHYFNFFPDDIRTGATFVHDLFALAVVVVGSGHLWMAGNDPQSRAGMRTGWVNTDWAEREHAEWLTEAVESSAESPRTPDV